jgi:hypothetical protein
MITATRRFIKFYGENPPESSLKRKLFYRGTPFSERIRIAKKEIERRK